MKSCPIEVFEFTEVKILPSDFWVVSRWAKEYEVDFALEAASPDAAAKDFTPAGPASHPVLKPDPKPTHLFRNLHADSVMTIKPSWFATVDDTPKKPEI